MTPSNATVDPARCPLCGGPNGCRMASAPPAAAPPQPCWCAQADFPAELLERVPPQARRKACICPACVAAGAARATSTAS